MHITVCNICLAGVEWAGEYVAEVKTTEVIVMCLKCHVEGLDDFLKILTR